MNFEDYKRLERRYQYYLGLIELPEYDTVEDGVEALDIGEKFCVFGRLGLKTAYEVYMKVTRVKGEKDPVETKDARKHGEFLWAEFSDTKNRLAFELGMRILEGETENE